MVAGIQNIVEVKKIMYSAKFNGGNIEKFVKFLYSNAICQYFPIKIFPLVTNEFVAIRLHSGVIKLYQ